MKKTVLTPLLLLLSAFTLSAQDTLKVSLHDFIQRGAEMSGQIQYERGAVDLAENRIDEARATRILPSIHLNTNHGLIPGVTTRTDLGRNELYLDPNLSNDWEDWAVFTRAEINAVQPIFTWGAINKAITAAEYGAVAARKELEANRQGVELQLYELYYSYLLAREIERVLVDAEETVEMVGRQLDTMEEENDPNLRERDIFQYEIYMQEFEIQKTEVRESVAMIQRIWNYIMNDSENIYEPLDDFLDPVPFEIQPFDFYQSHAMEKRPEIEGVDAGIEAYRNLVESTRAQSLPTLYLGLTANYANTPNRPRQSNPFIINNTNFMSAAVGFGIRQNLNFSSVRNQIQRERIEYNRVRDLKWALSDGIMLQLNENYMDAVVAETRVQRIEDALVTTRNWVRHEQLNYDYGFGEVEDLVDSVRRELELRVELQQRIFEMNTRVAALYHASGIPLSQLSTN